MSLSQRKEAAEQARKEKKAAAAEKKRKGATYIRINDIHIYNVIRTGARTGGHT